MRKPRRFQRPAALLLALALAPVLSVLPVLPGGLARAQGPAYRAPVEAPKAPAQGDQAQQQAPAPGGQAPAQPAPKFPNKDTAKNRKDYEMGTDSGGTILGRDAQTGDTVILHVPPKKNQPPQDVEKPIEVKPVVPLIWK